MGLLIGLVTVYLSIGLSLLWEMGLDGVFKGRGRLDSLLSAIAMVGFLIAYIVFIPMWWYESRGDI